MTQLPGDDDNAGVVSSPTLTTGKVYADYDRIVQRIEAWVERRNPTILGCDNVEVKSRLAQRIIELSSEEYVKQVGSRLDERGKVVSPESAHIETKGITICSASGEVSLSYKQWMHELLFFVAIWLRMFAFLFISIFRWCPRNSVPATLLMEGGGGYEDGDERFVQFCRKGPIEVLATAQQIIVRSPRAPMKSTDASFKYVVHPLIYFASTNLTRQHRISLLTQHVLAPVVLLRALIACSFNVLLSSDIAYIPLVRWLDRKSLIEAIVVTTSSFQSQPLWMKGISDQRFKLNMVWYSQNFMPKVYKGEFERSNLPEARHMRVDIHWVWTEGFKVYLEEIGSESDINVVGPILWYLPEKVPIPTDADLKLAVFDITPAHEKRPRFGALKNYYSVEVVKKFILDIVERCAEVERATNKKILILVKHKRMPREGHNDFDYISFLKQMESSNKYFKLIDHQTNLFGLLSNCQLSISVPYTSTAYVASSLNRNTIYYDPFGELVPIFENNDYVHFASGEVELLSLIQTYLGEVDV